MIAFRCGREDDVLDALSAGRWPDAVDPELRAHVEECAECRDLVVVAEALVDDRRENEAHADLPSSGAVWWRMQLRAEREAKEAAEKTVGRVHGAVIGVTVAAVALVLLASSVMKLGWEWMESAVSPFVDFANVSSSLPLVVVGLVTVVILIFAPVVAYLALAKE